MNFFKKIFSSEKSVALEKGVEKTKKKFWEHLLPIFGKYPKINDEVLEQIEESLLLSDLGTHTTQLVIQQLREQVKKGTITTDEHSFQNGLMGILSTMLLDNSFLDKINHLPSATDPFVILVTGVNGVGKTTTIGKMAHFFKSQGLSVVLGAADTFRAAAIEQLEMWSQKVGCDIVKNVAGGDPAAVAHQTVQYALTHHKQIVLIDTAGRLHNKKPLMDELSKIIKVIKKILPSAPQETFLVLDASTGQNALEQARQFSAVAPISSWVITKMDGTSKGGIVFALSEQLRKPIAFIGVGEKIDDLLLFNKQLFIDKMSQK
ncbi:MAG: signal recognition particle-docking protein FtsY [Phycisphaerales bacterium]|nr:signal recognition particle-docking protein FtsY [Phycisphaerales bacterium]